jgi:hypothetical protein
MQRSGFRSSIPDGDLNQDVFRRVFGVLNENIEIAVVVKHAGVEQFIFHLEPAATPVGFDQVFIRESALRILVEVFHVGMRRRAVEVEVIFFDVLAVVSLAVRKPEKTFLQNRIFAVPQRQRETKKLLIL